MFALWLSSAAPAVPVSRKAGIISPGDDVARCLERADGKCTVAEKGLVQKGGTPGDSTGGIRKYRKDYNDALKARADEVEKRRRDHAKEEGVPGVHDHLVPKFGLPPPAQFRSIPRGYAISYGRLIRVPQTHEPDPGAGLRAPSPDKHVLPDVVREAPQRVKERERADMVHKVQATTPGLDVPPKWWLEPPVWMRDTPWWLKRLASAHKNDNSHTASDLERVSGDGHDALGQTQSAVDRRRQPKVDTIPSIEFVDKTVEGGSEST